MSKRKICVVITARPSYSRIKTALQAIKDHPGLELQLVVSASALLDRYGSSVNYIEEDGFEITAKVFNVIEGENLTVAAKTTGIGIIELSTIFYNIKPDIVVTIADRFETMATAIASSYMNIPLAHVQGGEVTGNIDEKVRHSITKLADYHFVASGDALERVIKMGENPDFVFNTGCPSMDIAAEVLQNPILNFNPVEKYKGVGIPQDAFKNGYLVVMQHPVTTEFSEAMLQITETLEAVMELNIPTYWFWPNVDAGSDGTSTGIRVYREQNEHLPIRFFKNMKSDDFLRLLYNAKCLIGNSSVGIRECCFLGVPVVNVGSRQNKRFRGPNVLDTTYHRSEIVTAVNRWINSERPKPNNHYGKGNAGNQIAELLNTLPLNFHKTISY
jgi:UDP-hydrolysing UDP-N-acetyl-D-glucosamine 2-epimerase